MTERSKGVSQADASHEDGLTALSSRTEAERQKNVTLARKLESTQEDLMKTQIKYFLNVNLKI